MANHKSALKRIRRNGAANLLNKYQHKTARNAVRDLRASTKKKDAQKQLPSVIAMLHKLVKNNIIHKNKAGNLQESLQKHVDAL